MPLPSNSTPTDTVGRILATAIEAFADKGFAGARMDEIAKSAGVNKATIYYHIGNKQALYSAVLHDTLGHQAGHFAEVVGQAQTPEEKLRCYVRCIVENIQRHPALPRIFMREAASLGAHLPPQGAADLTRIIGVLVDLLAEGQEQGVFVKATPVLIHFMIVGALGYFAQMEGILKQHAAGPVFNHPPIGSFEAAAIEVENLVINAVRRMPATPLALTGDASKGSF